ncbi:hypothetical protein JMJ77_0009146, partial [Colletotrichum scovillei]
PLYSYGGLILSGRAEDEVPGEARVQTHIRPKKGQVVAVAVVTKWIWTRPRRQRP